ncbi:DegV family protein [Chloroflexota bacterium]
MIKIVTDSTAYLPDEFIREHDIQVVPLCVHFGEEEFKECVNLTNEEFYARLKKAPELPTTSQPSAGEFYEVYKELDDAGHEILTLTISSKLSGTWNSAMAAKEMLPEAKISIVDSQSTSLGLQLMVDAAVQAVNEGATRAEAVERIEIIRDKVQVLFVVDTLEYLAKGGRIGNGKAFMGTMLRIKPILALQDGAIEPLEQVRSKRKALARMEDLIVEHAGSNGAQAKVTIAHALAPHEAEAAKDDLCARLGCPQPVVTDIGPVIGTHTGPGVVGVAIYV